MSKLQYIGIDPGATKESAKSGGVAILDDEGMPVRTFPIPTKTYTIGKTGKDRIAVDTVALTEALIMIANERMVDEMYATIEHPAPLPKKFDVPTKATCELFMHYGAIKAVLDQLCGTVFPVYPQSWKRGYNLDRQKAASLALAREMFPAVDLRYAKDHNVAEALLIAEYGRLSELGKRQAPAKLKEHQRYG